MRLFSSRFPPRCPHSLLQATQGLCGQPFMRSMNWTTKTMVQHCAKECGCDATPALRKSVELPRPDWCCGFSVGNYFEQDPFSRENV